MRSFDPRSVGALECRVLAEERVLLIRSFAALLAAVHR
jgi:hypothetical protein